MSEPAAYVESPRKGRAALYVAIAIGIVVVVLVAILFTRKSAGERSSFEALRNQPAPAIAGQTLDGTSYNIDSFRGRWVVVNFFATWCVPCVVEHPVLESFAARHEQAGDAELVSVVFQDSLDNVRSYFAKNGGDWPVIVDDDGRIALDYALTGVPETVLIDPAGIVRERITSGVQSGQLDAEINALTLQYFPQATDSG